MWVMLQSDGLTVEAMPSATGWFRLAAFCSGWLGSDRRTTGSDTPTLGNSVSLRSPSKVSVRL